MFLVGGGGMKQIVKGVAEGNETIPVTVLYPPAMIATAMDLTVERFFSNGPVEGTFNLSSQLITEENAKSFYFEISPYCKSAGGREIGRATCRERWSKYL